MSAILRWMSRASEFYRREIPAINLSLERCTGNVPNDGMFYLVHDGRTLGHYRTEREALARFREVVEEIGYQPEPQEAQPLTPAEENAEHYFYSKEMYWGESHKHREKGGPGK